MKQPRRKTSIALPGFRRGMAFSLAYLSFIVILPLGALIARGLEMGPYEILTTLANYRVLAAFRVTLLCAFAAASINLFFGSIVAWVLVRYEIPGKQIFDAIIDLPFALPTAVSGIAMLAIYGRRGVVGQYFEQIGFPLAYTTTGITLALIFVSFPFVVRTLQPALEELDPALEEAAKSLGANRFHLVTKIFFPSLLPAMLTGFTLAFARSLGEYGSVVFISGNLPGKTEILPILVVGKLEQYDYNGAVALGFSMLVLSFILLLGINMLQGFTVPNKRREK